jgi:outer membrane protein assembly factor BamA
LLNDALGRNSSHTSGIGPNLIFDFRNNPFSPTRGWFLELSYVPHNRKLQSEYTFKEVLIDGRKYFELPRNQFIGFQTLGNLSWGDVPLRELPRLGGVNMMRGMVQGRYRDKNMIALQTEYRKGLNRFLKISAFGSGGMVSENIRDFSKQNIYFTYGLGLRILVNKKKNLYSRIDIARSSEGNFAFYFKLMDAF